MTHLAVAAADAPAPAGPPTAAALAARIQIPRRLPIRYDGQPLRHLSHSSYTRFLLCPEDWRRHYLKGERTPPAGRCSSAAASTTPSPPTTGASSTTTTRSRSTRSRTPTATTGHERLAEGRVDWDAELTEPGAFQLGLDALELTFTELVPRLGTPVAAQRKLEFALAPGSSGRSSATSTSRPSAIDEAGTTIPTVVDYKVKSSVHSQASADHDPQAGLYLAGRWLDRRPGARVLLRADRQARQAAQAHEQPRSSPPAGPSVSCAARSPGSRRPPARSPRSTSASGPTQPWGFADPSGWKCAPPYCRHHARCPGGAGL